jgi:HAMP domain-containing protein
VQVADPFQLTVTVLVAEGTDVTFPAMGDKLGQFDVLSHRDIFDVPVSDGRSWTRTIELESLDTGNLEVPGVGVVIDGEPTLTQPIPITVQSLLAASSDPLEFRPLKLVEVIDIEGTFWERYWIHGTVAAVIGVVSIAGWSIWRWLSARTNPERWAFRRIDQLEESGAFKQRKLTVVLPRAADILRAYIERRFDIAATRQTTEEFLQEVQFAPSVDVAVRKDLEDFLRHIDAIKFAHLVPESTDLHETLQRVRTLVQRCGELTGDASRGVDVAESYAQGDASHVVVR